MLKTKRLELIDFAPSHRGFIQELDSDPEVMKYLSGGIPSDQQEVDRAMGVFLSFKEKFSGRYGYWPARLAETGELIGWFHLRPLKACPDNYADLEIGYRLLQKFWGQGFATEMSKALVRHGFLQLSAKRIWAHAMKANIGSQKVMKNCGLKLHSEEMYLPFPGEDKVSVWYLLDVRDFH